MASSSQPWMKHIDDIGLDVALLHNNTSSGRSSPSPDQGLQMHPFPKPHLSRSASESQISPVGSTSSSFAPAHPSTDLNTEGLPPNTPTGGAASPSFLRHPNSASFRSQGSSPLNPFVPHPSFSPFARAGPRPSALITRIPSEEARALSVALPASNIKSRGSMILYRLSDGLTPPTFPNRDSVLSTSGDSFVSLSADSKYPAGQSTTERGLVAYAFDPFLDDPDPTDDDPSDPDHPLFTSSDLISGRGLRTLGMLLLMLAGLLSLFVVYPVFTFLHNNGVNTLIADNARINSTGQAVIIDLNPRSQIPISTPHDAWMRTGSDGSVYELVFSDEFDSDGRSFSEGNDLFWAVDDPYYDRHQFYTRNGHLVMSAAALSSGVRFRLGNPFCLRNGFVEVGVVDTEGDAPQRIYWSGAWSSVYARSGIVPYGSSLTQTLLLDLQFGVAANDTGRSKAVPPPPRDVLVDYVRVYQMKTIAASSCDRVTPPQRALAFLDVLHLS